MSNMIYRLLPNSAWVLCSVNGNNKEFKTFQPNQRNAALTWIAERSFGEVKILTANPNRVIFGNPTLEHIKDVLAIGIRADTQHLSAIMALNPAEAYPYNGKVVAIWRLKRKDGKPVSPSDANDAEAALAEKFNATRLKFFAPIPSHNRIHFGPWSIEPKDVASMSVAPAVTAEDNEELSADCAPEKRKFAIEPIAQRGAITLISGDAGMGKSQIALHLAMCVTRAVGLPGQPAPMLGGVLCCEEEDDWKADVVPRLIANGANRKLIKGIRAQDLHTEKGTARLTDIKKRFEAEIRLPVWLLILSPYMACFGGGSNQEVHMREKLKHIASWAKRSNVAVVGVAHLDDAGGVAGPKTHRRLARASWKVIEDEDTGQRLFVCDKANNTADDFKLAYRIQGVKIDGGIRTSKIVWEDANFRHQEAPEDRASDPSPESAKDRAVAALQDILRGGPMPSNLALEKMRNLGFSENRIYAAKNALKIPNGTKGKIASWELPKDYNVFRIPSLST